MIVAVLVAAVVTSCSSASFEIKSGGTRFGLYSQLDNLGGDLGELHEEKVVSPNVDQAWTVMRRQYEGIMLEYYRGSGAISYIRISDRRFLTAEGVGVGDASELVRRTYGPGSRSGDLLSFYRQCDVNGISERHVLTFRMDGDRVKEIFVHVAVQ